MVVCIYEGDGEVRICAACGEKHPGGLTAKAFFELQEQALLSDAIAAKTRHGWIGQEYHKA